MSGDGPFRLVCFRILQCKLPKSSWRLRRRKITIIFTDGGWIVRERPPSAQNAVSAWYHSRSSNACNFASQCRQSLLLGVDDAHHGCTKLNFHIILVKDLVVVQMSSRKTIVVSEQS
jgi:hypothetical protein